MHYQSEFQCDPFQDRPAEKGGQEWVELEACAAAAQTPRSMPPLIGAHEHVLECVLEREFEKSLFSLPLICM